MVKVLDVAKGLLTFESMSHKKLQKLCYYVYAWYLTIFHEHLFIGPFEAWIHGPVHPDLYQEYKDFGWQPIPKEQSRPDAIDNNTYQFLGYVYQSYGELSGDQLEAVTHDEEPWIQARRGLHDYEPSSNPLDDQIVIDYYSRKLQQ